MASAQKTVDVIVEQVAAAGAVSVRKMFGEDALYCGGKLVALICDDQLFVKATPAGRAWAGDAPEASPYPGAKPCLLIAGERWDDGEWLAGLVRITAEALPEPAPKTRKVRSPKIGG